VAKTLLTQGKKRVFLIMFNVLYLLLPKHLGDSGSGGRRGVEWMEWVKRRGVEGID
jgi:hypothetical protein